jgi:hypothetical protein
MYESDLIMIMMLGGIRLMSMGVVRFVVRSFAVCTDQYLGAKINHMSETAEHYVSTYQI